MRFMQSPSPCSSLSIARLARTAVVVCGLAALAACAPGIDDSQLASQAPGSAEVSVRSDEIQSTSAPGFGEVAYHNGRVISTVRVTAVYWNSNVAFQSTLTSFYSTIASSTYIDWLREYNTPTQFIARGSLVNAVVDPSPPANTNLQDTDVTDELVRLINAGTLAVPGPNDLYMVHMPPGFSVTHSGRHSCPGTAFDSYCGYHNRFVYNGTIAYYGIIGDLAPCGSFCGPGTALANTTATASHELLEAITDPGADAWFEDQRLAEISDICQDQDVSVSGFTVMRAWSRLQQDCVVKNPCLSCPSGFSCRCGDFFCRSNTGQCP
ncbi:MAG TPA: hypothetical protein VF516_44180 [Kofleriaceae bacterium]